MTAALDCGHPPTPTAISPGYATLRDSGKRVCYPCADDMQRADLKTTDTISAYICSNGNHVTTWTGGRLMQIVSANTSRNGWHRSTIHYWRAIDPSGQHWYGKNGGNGMYVLMRKTKGK